jgi:hypothetical protein
MLTTSQLLISTLTFLLEYAGGCLVTIEPIVALEGALPTLTASDSAPRHERTAAENCAKIRKLGFTTSSHIKMYGQDLELMSDPFEEGGHTAVRVVSEADQTERTVHLPVSILVGLAGLFESPDPTLPSP